MTKNLKKTNSKIICILMVLLFIQGCSNRPQIPENNNFSKERYLGRWYEVKRYDHRFERGLTSVTAEYSRGEKGRIDVVNRGVKKDATVSEFYAFAKETEIPNYFKLYPKKFPVFGASYRVAWIDENYNYAIVGASSFKYLWFLSREKTIPTDIYEIMVEKAENLGYDTDKLIDGQ